ncbi:MAG: hypothetical protein H6711_07805 [Myxococcales bacterium]|nr:hypothetical protein [Myxococcales bacterium]
MVFRPSLLALASVSLVLGACSGDDPDPNDGFTDAEIAKMQDFSPAPTAINDTTNKFADNEDAAMLGHRLFFDAGYSGPIVVGDDGSNGGLGAVDETGKVSCRSCHLGDWLIDTRSQPNGTSLAIDWFFRNAPTLANVATYETQFGWVGFNDNLWGKSLIPAEFVMGTTRTGIVRYLYANYQADFDAIFDTPLDSGLDPASPDIDTRFPADASPIAMNDSWAMMADADKEIVNEAYANFGKALAAYQRKLITGDSDFDRYVAGDREAMSASAKRGLKLFIGKAACDGCHKGPTFSDEKFHVTGVEQIGDHVLGAPDYDPGRNGAIPVYLGWDFNTAGKYNDDPSINRTTGVAEDPALLGAFRTKGLRNVAMTGPYMHTGHLNTLREVVEFYNEGGAASGFAGTKDPLMVPLNLTETEIDDIVAFLEALTGDNIPGEWLVDPT